MRIKLQYFLVVLLFAFVGVLCRQHQPVRAAHNRGPICSCVCGEYAFSQSDATNDSEDGRYFNHALFAPELTGGILSQNTDNKTLARAISLFGSAAPACPAVDSGVACEIADLHPGGVDYYIYTLGKIRI